MTTVYQGNVSSSLVRVGELFRDAVRLNAAGLILVHNHPSGDPTGPNEIGGKPRENSPELVVMSRGPGSPARQPLSARDARPCD